jgi:hypothetical protein
MLTSRVLFCLTVMVIALSAPVACKRKKSEATISTGGPTTNSDTPGAAAVVVDPPKNLPPNSLPLPKPVVKPWSQRSQPEKLVMIDYWLNQHQFGDPAQKAKVVSEIRGAGLSPADFKVLEETRTRFGYQPLGF